MGKKFKKVVSCNIPIFEMWLLFFVSITLGYFIGVEERTGLFISFLIIATILMISFWFDNREVHWEEVNGS